MSKYKPLFGRVIIKREVLEKKGSIVLPAHLQKKHSRSEGVVIALGPTAGILREGEESCLKVGDHVVFGKHSGAWLDSTYTGSAENDDGTTFICQDEDILAVIEQGE